MPLYEFYCEPCHTIFTFRSARVDTATLPACPQCGKALRREVSCFSYSVRGKVQDASEMESDDANASDRMDRMLAQMGERMQALEDDDADPREAVKVMRELASAGGLHFNKGVQEAMARIEAGEDPEKIDAEFSEVLDTDNPFADGDEAAGTAGGRLLRRLRGPKRDPKWYDLA